MRDFSHDLSALALNTATLGHNMEGAGRGWGVEQIIDGCAARGISGLVLWQRELGARAAEIGQRLRAAGLSAVGLCRSPYVVGPEVRDPQAMLSEFARSIDLTAELGAETLTVVVGGVEPESRGVHDSLQRAADRIFRMVDHAAQAGIRLALEPLHPAYAADRSCLVSVSDAVRVCSEIDNPVLGIAVDAYHVWWDTGLPDALARLPQGQIFGYHLCDWLRDTKDILLDRGMMGDGVIDLKPLRATVENAGYAGPCEVEVFSVNNWWRRDPDEVLDTVVERFRTVC